MSTKKVQPGIPMMKQRGRPPKVRYIVPLGMSDPLCLREVKALVIAVRAFCKAYGLIDTDVAPLTRALAKIIPQYRAMEITNQRRKTLNPRGNKKKFHVSLLLRDCCELWRYKTGKQPLWESPTSPNRESPPVALARVCMEVASGRSDDASLRQQFSAARRWSRL